MPAATTPKLPPNPPPPPKTIADAATYASWAVNAIATGELDVRSAREITGLLRELRSAIEKGQLEARVRKLEAELKAAKAAQAKVKGR